MERMKIDNSESEKGKSEKGQVRKRKPLEMMNAGNEKSSPKQF